MATTGNILYSMTVLGSTVTKAVATSTDGGVVKNPSLAVAKVGSLTTRTSDTVGTLTMAASHGITTGARLDIYWSGGSRYGVTVGTVATNEVPFTLGAGDNLPADETAVTAMVPSLETFPVPVASAMIALMVGCDAVATAVFRDSGGTALATVRTSGPTGGYIWESTSGVTNPFGSTANADVYMSHADSGTARVVTAVAQIN